MASAFDKQHSSRPNVKQILAYLGGGATVASTNFGVATQQIRVVSEVQGWLSIGSSTTVTVGSNGFKISANVEGEYFTTSPVDVSVGDPLLDANRFDGEARKAAQAYLRLRNPA